MEELQKITFQPITFKLTIGGEDYTTHTPFPIKWSSLLDERLDEGRISLKHCKRELFPPMTPVKIISTSRLKTVEKSFIVAMDGSVETPVGSGWFNHEIQLIEETKLLEGFIVEALTFTNDLGRNYTNDASLVTPYIPKTESEFPKVKPTPPTYLSPLSVNQEFTFVSVHNIIDQDATNTRYTFKIYRNDNIVKVIEDNISNGGDVSFTTILEQGIYLAYYKVDSNIIQAKREVYYYFNVVTNQAPLPKWNITSVINRVLELAETHLKGTAPRYRLNGEQAAEFEKITAPEFAFTKSTLKEILDQIGGFIHGIPRLKNGEIYFDMLGGTKVAMLSGNDRSLVLNAQSQNIESYCTRLDSSVDNLVNILDETQGVIVEPCADAYKTVRTETIYARIEEGNMCISTAFPIQNITKVECGIIKQDGDIKIYGGDITPYVFESADYNRMSSYEENYPTSKAYALYFTQGQKNIYGLSFKVNTATNGVFKNYAIVNIIKETSGVDIKDYSEIQYSELAFKVTYTPIFNARVQASKMNISEYSFPRTLAYNQGGNLVETRYYGENMKGLIARMGNVEKIRTYTLLGFNQVPEIGEIFEEDYYVSSVDVEVFQTMVKCTVGLSKDFNRLSQYIGINSVKRYYEVSEKQAYNRDMNYIDYVVIGDEETADDTWAISSNSKTIKVIKQIFTQQGEQRAVNLARIRSLAEGIVQPIQTVALPVVSSAFGNSVVFSFAYEDNYSAGLKSQLSNNINVGGYFTQSVPYGDYYGRIDYFVVDLCTSSGRPQTLPEQTRIGTAFPEITGAVSDILSTPGNAPLVVKKDGAEIISLNYQIEFVTNKKNFIIGSAISRNCPLIRGTYTGHSAKLYILPERLGKFTEIVNLNGATPVTDYGVSGDKINIYAQSLKFEDEQAPIDGASWAIVDGKSGELLIGCNLIIESGTTLTMPFMTFKHNIFK